MRLHIFGWENTWCTLAQKQQHPSIGGGGFFFGYSKPPKRRRYFLSVPSHQSSPITAKTTKNQYVPDLPLLLLLNNNNKKHSKLCLFTFGNIFPETFPMIENHQFKKIGRSIRLLSSFPYIPSSLVTFAVLAVMSLLILMWEENVTPWPARSPLFLGKKKKRKAIGKNLLVRTCAAACFLRVTFATTTTVRERGRRKKKMSRIRGKFFARGQDQLVVNTRISAAALNV